jgi:hypothetical protein
MATKVLFVGRLNIVVEDAKGQLQIPDLELFSATDLAQVKAVFEHHSIQHVFMGAGLELEQRIEIVRTVFQESNTTTVHLKDVASGPQGFFPFVRAILIGLQHCIFLFRRSGGGWANWYPFALTDVSHAMVGSSPSPEVYRSTNDIRVSP